MGVDIANLLSNEGSIARRLDGYETRPQQIDMAVAIEHAMDERGNLVVEAGTGVGKSYAYLLPAIKRIVEHDERVVIATQTINLQEQLLDKDVPLLNAVIPEEFSSVLVKGRGNYVSLRRLQRASERQDKLFPTESARHDLYGVEDWAGATDDGSRASLLQMPRQEIWDAVQSDAGNCMGRKCPTYDRCFFQRARRRMEHGDLLICNHALFFSDLALRMQGVGFLPPYDHVILDEAHAIEDVAAEHFGLSLSRSRILHLLRMLHHPTRHRGALSALKLDKDDGGRIDRAINQVLDCVPIVESFFAAWDNWAKKHGPANGRVREPDVVDNTLTPAIDELVGRLRIVRDRVTSTPDELELSGYINRATDIAMSATNLVSQSIDGCVYWYECEEGARFTRQSLKCMAVDVAPLLREHLFDQEQSVTLTSATLATGRDDFKHVTQRLGCEDATTLQVGSPFDYPSQMEVVIDSAMPEPNSRDFNAAAAARVRDHVNRSDGGAFVLFTSFQMLRAVTNMVREDLESNGHLVLEHGADGPPGQLLDRFRNDDRAVLFGTGRFWQGVDVRGRGLRCVMITRLPFAVPDQPLLEARQDAIRERGGHPFMEDQLPNAVIRFKQGIGRLIRSSTDEGRIVVLDPRVLTKSYGKAFLKALPADVRIRHEPERCDDESMMMLDI